MSTKLYYTQGIHDFQVKGTHYSEERLEVHLVRKRQRCPECGSTDITLEILCERDVRGLPMGLIREVCGIIYGAVIGEMRFSNLISSSNFIQNH